MTFDGRITELFILSVTLEGREEEFPHDRIFVIRLFYRVDRCSSNYYDMMSYWDTR